MKQHEPRSRRCRAKHAAILAALAGGACGASAQTDVTWASATSGNWNTASNWSPAQVPNNMGPMLFNARITPTGAAYTVTLDIDPTIENLTLDSADATLDISNRSLTVNGTSLLGRGELFGAAGTELVTLRGAATFQGGAIRHVRRIITETTLTIDTSSTTDEICETEIDHRGTSFTWIGNNDILTGRGAQITNGASSVFQITGNGQIRHNGMGAFATLTNAGTMIKSGAGVTLIDEPTFNNTGTLEVTSGTLRANNTPFAGGILSDGTWIVRPGATIDLVGQTFTVNQASVTLDGAGSVFSAVDSLTSNDAGARLNLRNGRNFTTAAAFLNAGTVDAGDASNFHSSGSLTNQIGGTISAGASGTIRSTGNMTNTGTIQVGALGQVVVDPGSTLTNASGGVLSGGTFILGGLLKADNLSNITDIESNITLDGAASGIENNAGVNAITNLAEISSNGSLDIRNGKNITTTGNFSVGAASRLAVGAGSTFRVPTGFQLTNFVGGQFTSGTFQITGTLQAPNLAVQQIDNDLTIDGPDAMFLDDDGNQALSGLDTITGNGALSVQGGATLTVATSLTAQSGARLAVSSAGSQVTVNVNLNQQGGTVSASNGGTLQVLGEFNQTAGTLNLAGGSVTASNFNLSGNLTGNGTLNGNVVSEGVIQPGSSPGLISISGDLMLAASSGVDIELGGLMPDQFDRIVVTGHLNFESMLAGTLIVRAVSGYIPVLGDEFAIMTFASRDGRFLEHDVMLGGGLTGEVLYDDHSIILRVVPAPAAISSLFGGLLICSRRRRQ